MKTVDLMKEVGLTGNQMKASQASWFFFGVCHAFFYAQKPPTWDQLSFTE